eukprot:807859_1
MKRGKFDHETLVGLKRRHSMYYWLARFLIEAVLNFGSDSVERFDWNEPRPFEPPSTFYCGITVVINIPAYTIYLKGPCSTTKHKEIALKFSTRDGMVMELMNDTGTAEQQRFFNCSWVSQYKEEEERLFIAAEHK